MKVTRSTGRLDDEPTGGAAESEDYTSKAEPNLRNLRCDSSCGWAVTRVSRHSSPVLKVGSIQLLGWWASIHPDQEGQNLANHPLYLLFNSANRAETSFSTIHYFHQVRHNQKIQRHSWQYWFACQLNWYEIRFGSTFFKAKTIHQQIMGLNWAETDATFHVLIKWSSGTRKWHTDIYRWPTVSDIISILDRNGSKDLDESVVTGNPSRV